MAGISDNLFNSFFYLLNTLVNSPETCSWTVVSQFNIFGIIFGQLCRLNFTFSFPFFLHLIGYVGDCQLNFMMKIQSDFSFATLTYIEVTHKPNPFRKWANKMTKQMHQPKTQCGGEWQANKKPHKRDRIVREHQLCTEQWHWHFSDGANTENENPLIRDVG